MYETEGLERGGGGAFLPVVEERLRVFEDVARAAAGGNRCFIHRHFKLGVEQVSDHTVGNEWPL